MHDRGFVVRLPAEAINLSLLQNVQTGFETHPASQAIINEGSLLGGEAAGA
jgi:hypothetical protein